MKGWLIMIALLALIGTGCAGSATGDDDAGQDVDTTAADSVWSGKASTSTEASKDVDHQTSSTTEPGSTVVTDPPKETEPMPSTTSPPDRTDEIDPGLAQLVDQAIADLSDRLGVDRDGIEVVSADLVEWPDTSLGCPQPGMAYRQVPMDGSLIVLIYGGVEYRYHTGGSASAPFLCE